MSSRSTVSRLHSPYSTWPKLWTMNGERQNSTTKLAPWPSQFIARFLAWVFAVSMGTGLKEPGRTESVPSQAFEVMLCAFLACPVEQKLGSLDPMRRDASPFDSKLV